MPLVISDAMFDNEGQLLFDDNDQSGVFGDVILVNGRPWPVMQVERRKYRFRILNASVSRTYEWRLDSGGPMVVIATDGGLMPAPRSVKRLLHGNAERYEVIIDFAQYKIGQRVSLRNISPDNNIDYTNTNKVMAFDVVAEASTTAGNEIPAVLNANNPVMKLGVAKATVTRTMDLVRSGGQWTINGQTWADVEASAYQMALANPALDAVEIWELRNDSGGWHHPLHIHLIDFRILDREVDRSGIRVAPRAARARSQGRRPRRGERAGAGPGEVRPAQRPVHDPLPQPGPRGPRHDGPVLGRFGRMGSGLRGPLRALACPGALTP